MDDMVRTIKLHSIVKMGIPGISLTQLNEFMQSQDQERKKWFASATVFDMADWIVEEMRKQK